MSIRARHSIWSIRCGVMVAIVSTLVGCKPSATGSPPPTRRDNVVEIIHGVEIVDPYRWLEDQESPETRAWIDAQNEYSHALLDGLPSRDAIQSRLGELMRIDRESAPIERNGRFFIWKKAADDDLWILYLRRGLDGQDEVLLDPHGLSPDHTTTVNISDISSDGRVLAYGIRLGGEDEVEIRLMDVDTGADLTDRLPRGLYRSLSFTKDAAAFYYGRRDRETGVRIFHHRIGTDPAEDTEVFGEGYGPDKWVFAGVSDSGRYLLLFVGHGWARSELYIKDLATDGPITPIVNDIDASFDPQFAGDRLIVVTDWEAPTRRILSVDPQNPERSRWREIVPASSDAIQDFSLVGGKLFVHYLHDVTSSIRVFSIDGEELGEVALPGLGSANSPSGRWESDTAFFAFQSFTTPRTVFRLDVETGDTQLWTRDAVPFDSDAYEVGQIWYHSKDGTRVPMFVVHKKGYQPDGQTPTLLYGYGGFNVSLTPRFSTTAALWVEHGGVYALANIRGGGEFGEEWHRAGMLENKQNVFDDFIAAAEWLIDNHYTNPSKLAIQGGSNGGLLVGAALTQRPELYRAVLCAYPDLDMVRYYQFKNNNAPAVLEYGNGGDPEQFKFLYAYSPYHRVVPGTEYPAVLLTTGDADTRVPPLQARKMTALLQSSTASDHPVLLLYDTKAGHSGGKPFAKVVEDLSLEIAFLFWQLGVE